LGSVNYETIKEVSNLTHFSAFIIAIKPDFIWENFCQSFFKTKKNIRLIKWWEWFCLEKIIENEPKGIYSRIFVRGSLFIVKREISKEESLCQWEKFCQQIWDKDLGFNILRYISIELSDLIFDCLIGD